MSQTLERGLVILDMVAERPRRIGEIAEMLSVHHSTALRLLHSLRRHGYVVEMPDHRYRLGHAFFRLSHDALAAVDLRTVAKPLMVELNHATGQTVHLAALEEGDVVYVEKIQSRHAFRTRSRVGAVAPIHSSALSKVILAYLSEDERRRLIQATKLSPWTPHTLTSTAELEADVAESHSRGFAFDNEENEAGIRCIAAPVFGCANKIKGSISITAPISKVDKSTLVGYLPALREVAQLTSKQLGWIGWRL